MRTTLFPIRLFRYDSLLSIPMRCQLCSNSHSFSNATSWLQLMNTCRILNVLENYTCKLLNVTNIAHSRLYISITHPNMISDESLAWPAGHVVCPVMVNETVLPKFTNCIFKTPISVFPCHHSSLMFWILFNLDLDLPS